MVTHEFIKKITPADSNELKGCLAFDGTRKIYPFGYVITQDDGRRVKATADGWNYLLDFEPDPDSPAYAPVSPSVESFRCGDCDNSLENCACPKYEGSECDTDDIKEGKACWGCHNECLGQLDHMGPGGCLYEDDELP